MPKKGVFNEWAAVLRHQDEMEKEQERQEYERNKVQQHEYRKSLEDQIKFQQQQYMNLLHNHKGQDQSFVEDQWKHEQKKINLEKAQMIQKKQNEVAMAQESLQKAMIQKERDKAVQIVENNSIKNQLVRAEQEEIKRIETKRATKLRNQALMKGYLDFQKGLKVQEHVKDKEADKVIAKISMEKEEEDFLKRNYYFEKLQQFQDNNNKKFDNLVKYMKADPSSLAEQRDQKMYLDGIRQEEAKWNRRHNEELRQRQNDISQLKSGLESQINEKRNNQIVSRRMEQYYGEQLKQKDDKDFERDVSEQEKFRNQQRQYYNSLNQQVKLINKRKVCEDMMTAEERQLNEKDIKAYEKMEPVLHSNKIGFHGTPKRNSSNMSKMQLNPTSQTDRHFAIQKQNIAHKATGNIIAPNAPIDAKNQDRYIQQALRAEQYGMRPAVSNRAYGGELMSRNSNVANQSYTYDDNRAMPRNNSIQRTGASIMNQSSNPNRSVDALNRNIHHVPQVSFPNIKTASGHPYMGM